MKIFRLFLLFLISCSSGKVVKSEHYQIHNIPKSWKKIESDKSDQAYIAPETNTIFVVNSLCGKYQKTSLEDLFYDLLSGNGVKDQYTFKKGLTHGRESIEFSATGMIDGVEVYILGRLFRKDRCHYDVFILNHKESELEATKAIFEEIVQSSTF